MKLERFELSGNILKVILRGPLDIAGAQAIDTPFSVISGRRDKVVVDLSGVGFLASIGIRVLVRAARTVARMGGRLVVYSPTKEARGVLQAAGIDKIIPIAADEAAAAAALLK